MATFGKARALSDDPNESIFLATRILNNVEPIRIVARKAEYEESLTDGLRLFTNPYASSPFDIGAFDDLGIRKIVAEKDGTFNVSCHPRGDLCLRMVHSVVGPGRVLTVEQLQHPVFVTHAKTARMAAGMKLMAVAELASRLCDNGFSFDKSRVKHIEACKPIPWGEAENYLTMLTTLKQNACLPEVVTTLRKSKRRGRPR